MCFFRCCWRCTVKTDGYCFEPDRQVSYYLQYIEFYSNDSVTKIARNYHFDDIYRTGFLPLNFSNKINQLNFDFSPGRDAPGWCVYEKFVRVQSKVRAKHEQFNANHIAVNRHRKRHIPLPRIHSKPYRKLMPSDKWKTIAKIASCSMLQRNVK